MPYHDGDFFFGLKEPRNALAWALTRDRHGITGQDRRALRQPLMVDELEPVPAKQSYLDGGRARQRPLLIRDNRGGLTGAPVSATHGEYQTYKEGWERSLQGVISTHTRYNDTKALLSGRKSERKDFEGFSKKCKAGLVAVLEENRFVHYALDGISMPTVVKKSPGYGRSVTASELRWLFRNRHTLKCKLLVRFYRNNLVVEAPWETDPELWTRYIQKSYRDFRGRRFLPDQEAFAESTYRKGHARPKLLKRIGKALDDYHQGAWRDEALVSSAWVCARTLVLEARQKALRDIDALCDQALTSRWVNKNRHAGVRSLKEKLAEEVRRIGTERNIW